MTAHRFLVSLRKSALANAMALLDWRLRRCRSNRRRGSSDIFDLAGRGDTEQLLAGDQDAAADFADRDRTLGITQSMARADNNG
ncbi:MAG: hypothetical protein ABSG84_14960 [Acidobacteriaceae bacterium]